MSVPGLPEKTPTVEVPTGVLPAVTIHVKYEASPDEVLSGTFVMRHPSLVDEAEISRRAAGSCLPTPFANMDDMDQFFYRSMAALTVLGVSAPKWYDPSSPLVRRDLPIAIYDRFLATRQGLFHVGEGEGAKKKERPLMEIVATVG